LENIDQIENTGHAVEILNSLIERSHSHFTQKSNKSGFLISYQDFLALSYIQVNQKVLQEEYNIYQKKTKEFSISTATYKDHQKKWIQKLNIKESDLK